ncbi:hypothetical protein OHW85_22760, partial [Acinetobacter baumannii]|nr:hypothetical protein [Acinetobacter baumannii]
MFDSRLSPYLFRATQKRLDVLPDHFFDVLHYPEDIEHHTIEIMDFNEMGLTLSDESESSFLSLFANTAFEAIKNCRIPLFRSFLDIPEDIHPYFYDVRPDLLYIVEFDFTNLSLIQKTVFEVLGLPRRSLLLKSNTKFLKDLGISYAITDSFKCDSFQLFFPDFERNLLAMFDKKYMNQQNEIVNTLLAKHTSYASFFFKQSIRQCVALSIASIEGIEVEVHDSSLCDNDGNLFF